MSDERQRGWRATISRIAHRLDRPDYPAGDLAALRRIGTDRAGWPAALWRLVVELAPDLLDRERHLEVLAQVVRAMALAHPFHRPMSGRRPMGMALAEADVSEMRLLRLLRLDPDALPGELVRLARLLASKGDAGRMDWDDAARLLADHDGEAIRRRIARDYFRTAHARTQTTGEAS